MNLLFDPSYYMHPLTKTERLKLAREIVRKAQLGCAYMYEVREAAGLLHITYDEIQTLLHYYRLDAILVMSAIRIPWWSLCEYLIDPAEDIDKMCGRYLKSLPHKETVSTTPKSEKQGEIF